MSKRFKVKVGDYARLAWNTNNQKEGFKTGDEILQKIKALSAEAEYQIDNAVQKLNKNNCYEGWEAEARYFLYQYESDLAKEKGENLSHDIWNRVWMATPSETIEHIFPQKADDTWGKGSEWEKHVHRLGNLLVLPKGLNSRARNYSFETKKALYRENYLRIMGDVIQDQGKERATWTISDIESREQKLLDWARKRWDDIK